MPFATHQLPWGIFASCRRGTGQHSWTRWMTSFDTNRMCLLAVESECARTRLRLVASSWGLPDFL